MHGPTATFCTRMLSSQQMPRKPCPIVGPAHYCIGVCGIRRPSHPMWAHDSYAFLTSLSLTWSQQCHLPNPPFPATSSFSSRTHHPYLVYYRLHFPSLSSFIMATLLFSPPDLTVLPVPPPTSRLLSFAMTTPPQLPNLAVVPIASAPP